MTVNTLPSKALRYIQESMDEPRKKNAAAVSLGRKGGKVRSERKANAVRENGKKGGRPKLNKDNIVPPVVEN